METGYPHIDKPWMKYYDDKSEIENDPNTNITEYLRDKNKHSMNMTSDTYYGNKITFGERFENVDKISKIFVSMGMKKGDRILLLVPNTPEAGQFWLAAAQIGVECDYADPRPTSRDPKINANKMIELLKREKINYIIALDKLYLAMLKPIENEIKNLGINQILTVSAADSMNIGSMISYLKDVIEYAKLKDIREKKQKEKELGVEIKEKQRKLEYLKLLRDNLGKMKNETEMFKEASSSSPLIILKYSDMIKERYSDRLPFIFDKKLVNYIGHTSGTSGNAPKPIALTNENEISAVEQVFRGGLDFTRGDTVLHELPFFAPMGAVDDYILTSACGLNQLTVPEFEPAETGYLLKKLHPNVIIGTPAQLATFMDCSYLESKDLSFIKRIIYGGDSMTEETEEKFNKWLKSHGSSAEIEKGHGMSEYGGCATYAKKPYNKYNSIGVPFPNTIYTIVDPNIEEILVPLRFKEGEEYLTGELAVSSKAVTSGVLDGKVIVPHYEMDGRSYIRTKDIVKMDRDGLFYFIARKDRAFTRMEGYKVKPYEIENKIKENDKVLECRVVEYFDEEFRGLMPIAHIVLKNNETLTKESQVKLVETIINDILSDPKMDTRQIPTRFRFRDALPITKNGKIGNKELINEGLTGEEICVKLDETNINLNNITVYYNDVKKLKLK